SSHRLGPSPSHPLLFQRHHLLLSQNLNSQPIDRVVTAQAKSPLILWHLLSFDAPTVATLWTWFIAEACHVHLPLASTLAMAAAVWTLYAADRLLDARSSSPDALEARHHFHQCHRKVFLAGIAGCSVLLAMLFPRIPQEAIRLYLVLGSLVF